MKKLLAILLAAIMCFALASCATGETGVLGETDDIDSGASTPDGLPTEGETGEKLPEEQEKIEVTATLVAEALNNLFAENEEEALPTADELKDAVPTYEELLESLALPDTDNKYLADVKAALDELEGELGQISMVFDGKNVASFLDGQELNYAGIKDGQLLIETKSAADAEEQYDATYYVTYDDGSVYAVGHVATEAGETLFLDDVQLEYVSFYQQLMASLPEFEQTYLDLVDDINAAIDRLYAAMEEAPELQLPAINADALVAVEDMENTYRLTDAYMESLIKALLQEENTAAWDGMTEPTPAQMILDVLKTNAYPYFTMDDVSGELVGIGLSAELDAAFLFPPSIATEAPCSFNVYVNGETGVSMSDVSAKLGNTFVLEFEANATPEGSTVKLEAEAHEEEVNFEIASSVTTKYDETGMPIVEAENTVVFDVLSTIGGNESADNGFGFEIDPGFDVQSGSARIKGTVKTEYTLDLSKLAIANAEILKMENTVACEIVTRDEVYTLTQNYVLSLKSEELGAYRFSLNANGKDWTGEDRTMSISCRFALGEARYFPTVPTIILDEVEAMKQDPEKGKIELDEMFGSMGGDVTVEQQKPEFNDPQMPPLEGTD